jgi:hypothetical protein
MHLYAAMKLKRKKTTTLINAFFIQVFKASGMNALLIRTQGKPGG